jgi:hypothetical protein
VDSASSRLLTASVALAGLVLFGGVHAEAQTVGPVSVVGPQRVTVKADGVGLGELLDRLAAIYPLDSLKIDPDVRSVPVSFVAEDVSAADAIWLALKSSGVDFVMSSARVRAGRAAKAVESAVVQSADAELPREEPPADPLANAVEPAAVVARAASPVLTLAAPGFMPVPSRTLAGPPAADQFGAQVGAAVVPFTLHEDSAVVTQPGFVPFKMRPDVKNRRLLANVGDIP